MNRPLCYLLVLLLTGCATQHQPPPMISPIEKACGAKATEFVRARYPDAELDDRGVPKAEGLFASYAPLVQWSTVYDQCTQKRGLND